MKIILTHEVTGLGAAGDVVEVKDGYARNYLVPRGFAMRWTKGGEKDVEQIRRARKIREIATLEQANEVKGQLEKRQGQAGDSLRRHRPALRLRHPGRRRLGDQGRRRSRRGQAPRRAGLADQDRRSPTR